MVTVQSISKYDKRHPTAITIGTFDGVHIGHRKILDRLLRESRRTGLKATVLTFFPHPRMVLQKDTELKLLNTIEEKTQIFEDTGLDFLIIHPFTREFSRLTALEFVRDILVNQLGIKKIIIGYDHRFGRNRNANIKDLRTFGNTFDFEVEEIPVQEIDEVSVSSTKIRKALLDGDVTTANAYLGYQYMLTGIVVRGKGLGRELNFPTANLKIRESHKLIPKNGAYAVQAVIDRQQVFGMMNIGFNPTVDGTQKSIEVHFFDYSGDLYEKSLQIRLIKRLRDERKFNSLNDLQTQLNKDKVTALALIKS